MDVGTGDLDNDCGSSAAFFENEETRSKLITISTSTWASYKSPTSEFQKIANILSVSLKSKLADTQNERGGNSCPILKVYREILKDSRKVERIWEHLSIAFDNAKKEKEKDLGYLRRQMSMTDFFQKKQTVAQAQNCTTQNRVNQSEQQEIEKAVAGTSEDLVVKERNQTNVQKLFTVFGISGASTVQKSLKISSLDSNKLEKTINLLQKLLGLLKSHDEKSAWTQRKSSFAVEKSNFLDVFDGVKTKIEKLVKLCDRSQDAKKAEELSFSEFTSHLAAKAKEAENLYKHLFLQINGVEFRKKMSSLIHKLQKQISRIDGQKDAATKRQFEITSGRSGKSWNECLQDLSDWLPSSKNGNITLDHFERCKSFFLALKIQQHDFTDAAELLDYLNLFEKRKTALKVLNENLPMMILEKGERVLVIDTDQFLQSPRMMADFTQLMMNDPDDTQNKSLDASNIKPGPEFERKTGSGRKRKIDEDPRILEVSRNYAESAGIAAHSRRREIVGNFGFTMKTLHKVVTSKLFPQDPDKAPSLKTLRRMFEPPNKLRNTSSYYKADIAARPGIKMNQESANGGAHEHRHQAFSLVKSAREFYSLFPHECVQMSCDNKVCVLKFMIHVVVDVKFSFFLLSGQDGKRRSTSRQQIEQSLWEILHDRPGPQLL